MPLTTKGRKILRAMRAQYGPEKGERVFYASINAGKITGAEIKPSHGGRKGVIRRRPRGSGSFTDAELMRGYKVVE